VGPAGSVRLEHDLPRRAGDGEPPQADDIAFVFLTSGTTAKRKVVPLRQRQALARAEIQRSVFDITPQDRLLNFMPMTYCNGASNAVNALVAGSSVISMVKFDVPAFFHCMKTLAPTWYTGGYTFNLRIHAEAAAHADAIAAAPLRFVRTVSGRLKTEVADELEAILGVPVVESYNSTETGRIASSPLPPQMRKRGTVGFAVAEDVAILDPRGHPVEQGQRGEVCVKGDGVIDGYENDPDANAEAFVNGWFRTGDEGFFDEDGYLTLTGRIGETINRGGEKISPAEVDAALLSHPGIREAVTFSIPHPTLGEVPAAAVVATDGVSPSPGEIGRYLADRLSLFKLPRPILVLDAIPKAASGKVQRRDLAEALSDELAEAKGAGAAEDRKPTPFEFRLQEIWENVLNRRDVGLDDNFFELGGDSLQAVDLCLRIEKELLHRLPIAVLFEAGTVSEMARLIEADRPQGSVVPIQPQGSRPPFFCVHGASGQVIGFFNLAKRLGDDQPLYGIQSVGWDSTTPPFTRTQDMAAHYVAEMRKVQPHGPYYLGGYSFGGRIAVYMANQLKAAGEEVGFLAIVDSAGLIGRKYVACRDWLERIGNPQGGERRRAILRYGWFRLRKAWDAVHARGRRAVLFPIREWYRARGLKVPLAMRRPDRLNVLIRVEHQSMPPYDGDAVYFRTEPDPRSMDHADLKDCWSRIICGRLEVVPVPGTHEEIIQEPCVAALADALGQRLTGLRPSRRSPTYSVVIKRPSSGAASNGPSLSLSRRKPAHSAAWTLVTAGLPSAASMGWMASTMVVLEPLSSTACASAVSWVVAASTQAAGGVSAVAGPPARPSPTSPAKAIPAASR
jgi:thioesterase domain-containing protein/acyl carrier protein